ncbi:MAG TPA: MFS transporter [Symbiobacteriaceae bacterium]|jgi:MFS family permease
MQNRTFLFIWLGHIISVLGDGFTSTALGFWIVKTTGSASAMAMVMTARVAAGILLGAVAGTVADRVDRRRLMIAMDVLRFIMAGGIAYLMFAGSLSLPVLIGLATLTAVCGQFFSPAFQASLVNIVDKDEVPKAAGLLQMSNVLAQVGGPLLGGTVVAFFGGWAALSGDAVSFLISALLILTGGVFASPRTAGQTGKSFWADLKEGLVYIRSQPMVKSVVTLAPVINFFGATLGVLIPVIAIKIWKTTSFQFGATSAALPLGFAIGAGLIMAMSKKIRHRGWVMMGAMIASGLVIAAAALAPSISVALPLMLMVGIGLALVNVLFQITLQAEVPTEVQGRVFGTLGSLVSLASPLSMLAAGFLGDAFSPALIAAIAGISIAVTAVGGLLTFPALRSYN